MAALLGACGGGDDSTTAEPSGSFDLRVTEASFPAKQRLGETSLLQLGIRNTGDRTVPTLAVTIGIAGKDGESSSLPFGIRSPQPELAQPDRPVWVLAATYPRFAGSSKPGGATTANPKTFALGPLEPGETARAIWKLSAVKAGDWTLKYQVGVGLTGSAKAVTDGDVAPGGSFVAEITSELPETEVTDDGEVVEIKGGSGKRGGDPPGE
jgi:hypothetical protein